MDNGKDAKNLADKRLTVEKNQEAAKDNLPVRGDEALKQSGETGIGNEHNADVNMEAAISTEDVERAGGFGARDDIGSFLPVAIDSTDLESSLRDARELEGENQEASHPGLGWSAEATNDKMETSDEQQQ